MGGEEAGHFCEVAGVFMVTAAVASHSVVDTLVVDRTVAYL